MSLDLMQFECMHCSNEFEGRWFDISRCREEVTFGTDGRLPEVDVRSGDGIGVFCSQPCLDAGTSKIMADEGVPIPKSRPGIGPIESCACCGDPVDMSEVHLTYSDGIYVESQDGVSVEEIQYLAVVCPRCEAGLKES